MAKPPITRLPDDGRDYIHPDTEPYSTVQGDYAAAERGAVKGAFSVALAILFFAAILGGFRYAVPLSLEHFGPFAAIIAFAATIIVLVFLALGILRLLRKS